MVWQLGEVRVQAEWEGIPEAAVASLAARSQQIETAGECKSSELATVEELLAKIERDPSYFAFTAAMLQRVLRDATESVKRLHELAELLPDDLAPGGAADLLPRVERLLCDRTMEDVSQFVRSNAAIRRDADAVPGLERGAGGHDGGVQLLHAVQLFVGELQTDWDLAGEFSIPRHCLSTSSSLPFHDLSLHFHCLQV